MSVMAPMPLAMTDEVVTFSRADWEAHLDRLEEAHDREIVRQAMAERNRLDPDQYARLVYTLDEMDRLLAGASPIVIWRDRIGMSQRALAESATISPSYLAEIERGQKPGSIAAISAIARALRVPMEYLIGQ
jgi:DNA-binding XRE family transcriptional regulator